MSLASAEHGASPASRVERLAGLREQLRRMEALPLTQGQPQQVLSSAWKALDGLLPDGGFPGGAVTEICGGPGSGKLSLLMPALAQLLSEGRRAAWISARGPLYAPALQAHGVDAAIAAGGDLLQICPDPRDADRVAWAAEQVLRAQVFDMVLVDALIDGKESAGSLVLDELRFQRLGKAARAGDAALLILLEPLPQLAGIPRNAALRLELRALPDVFTDPPGPSADHAGVFPHAPTVANVISRHPTPHRQLEVTLRHCRGARPGGQVLLRLDES